MLASKIKAVIVFAGNEQLKASVHRYGLRDQLSCKVKEVQYETRPLPGINKKDINTIVLLITEQLMKV